MTLLDLVTNALVLIGAINPDEPPAPSDLNSAISFLNALVNLWDASGLLAFFSTRQQWPISSGKSNYQWGTGAGADWTSQRPTKITNLYITDGGTDYPVDIIDEDTYDSIVNKSNTGRPFSVYLNPTYPNYTLIFYFVPDRAYTINIDSDQDLIDFTNPTSEILLPPEYQAALMWNLAADLCPSYSKEPPMKVQQNAADSLRILKRLNASNKLKPVRQNLFPRGTAGIWVYGDIQGGLPSD